MSRKNSKGGKKRANAKYPGLHQELHPKTRWEYLDGDYYKGLPEELKSYMSKFNEEYYGAALAKADQPVTWKNDFHSTERLRKDCTDRNNARNRDLYTILRTRGMIGIDSARDDNKSDIDLVNEDYLALGRVINYIPDLEIDNNQEDTLIEMIDLSSSQNIQEQSSESQLPQDQQLSRRKSRE